MSQELSASVSPSAEPAGAQAAPAPARFIGLDVHKHYLIAIGVNAQMEQVYGPQRVDLRHLDLQGYCRRDRGRGQPQARRVKSKK